MSLYRGPLKSGEADYDVQFGIGTTVAGVIIQSEEMSQSDIAHIVHDQYGRVANEISYDQASSNTFSFLGDKLPATIKVGDTFEYCGVTWKIDSVTEAGTFDGLRRWSVAGHAYYNYPDTAPAWDDPTNPAVK